MPHFLPTALLESPESAEERHAQQRMREMYELIEKVTDWFEEVRKLSPDTLTRLMDLGEKVQKLLEFKDKVKLLPSAKAKG